MTIEVLYFDGCPNHQGLAARIATLLEELELDTVVRFDRVESDDRARALRFLGSPTVRVDGRDVEPDAEHRTDYGLKCRLYRTPTGLSGEPPDSWIRSAIDAARS